MSYLILIIVMTVVVELALYLKLHVDQVFTLMYSKIQYHNVSQLLLFVQSDSRQVDILPSGKLMYMVLSAFWRELK